MVPKGATTLNLSAFDHHLPQDYKKIILHEFGHALGFLHEHQSNTNCNFNMDRIYAYYGAITEEDKAIVDHNIKNINLSGTIFSAHDKHSIMHYSFPHWVFFNGVNSPCYTTNNDELSEEDKIMMLEAYPFDTSKITEKDNIKISYLNSLLSIDNTSNELKNIHLEHLELLQ